MTHRTPAVVLAAAAAAVVCYLSVVRPRLLRAGATDSEVLGPYPGAGLIPGSTRSATMAVTIDAPPSRVWPWLVQMGTDRGGWYSWDRLDNFGRRSAETIHPEWQQIAVGDRLAATAGRQPVVGGCCAGTRAVLGPAHVAGSAGASVRPGTGTAASLHRLDLGLRTQGGGSRAHPAGGQRVLGAGSKVAATLLQHRLAGAIALGHADPPVFEPQAPRRDNKRLTPLRYHSECLTGALSRDKCRATGQRRWDRMGP